jgi:hypothetical protein
MKRIDLFLVYQHIINDHFYIWVCVGVGECGSGDGSEGRTGGIKIGSSPTTTFTNSRLTLAYTPSPTPAPSHLHPHLHPHFRTISYFSPYHTFIVSCTSLGSELNMSENTFIIITNVQIESPVFNNEKDEVESMIHVFTVSDINN